MRVKESFNDKNNKFLGDLFNGMEKGKRETSK